MKNKNPESSLMKIATWPLWDQKESRVGVTGRPLWVFRMKNEILITSVYIVIYAPKFKYFTRVPAWTHVEANIHFGS